jgi:hypothetical protein
MWPSWKSIVCAMLGSALVVSAASATFAATNQILTLNLAGSGPNGQIGMNGSGVLSTRDDGVAATTGDQNTTISYINALAGVLPNLGSPTASFTISDLEVNGPPTPFGSALFQNYKNGSFALYGPSPTNELLLSGNLSNSSTLLAVLAGGADPSDGTMFTSYFGTVTGGSLQNYIAGNSVALQMYISNAQTPGVGAGFHLDGGSLASFSAKSTVSILATTVPEPETLVLFCMAAASAIAVRRRQR